MIILTVHKKYWLISSNYKDVIKAIWTISASTENSVIKISLSAHWRHWLVCWIDYGSSVCKWRNGRVHLSVSNCRCFCPSQVRGSILLWVQRATRIVYWTWDNSIPTVPSLLIVNTKLKTLYFLYIKCFFFKTLLF